MIRIRKDKGLMDTPIRVFLKKLRFDNNEVMGDMAEKLGVTTSFLSAVELGKKNPPGSRSKSRCSL